jgi:hypothetical protein
MQFWHTQVQLAATVTNPVVGVSFRDGTFFTNVTMSMAAAGATAAVARFRCPAGLCPCLFRGSGFDQKKPLVVRPVVLASHATDHSLPNIDRVKGHIFFFAPTLKPWLGLRIVTLHPAPTPPELLSNTEQAKKIITGHLGTPDRNDLGRF